jgi:hypothetical protein
MWTVSSTLSKFRIMVKPMKKAFWPTTMVTRSLEEVPEDYIDFVCLGDNPEEYTVAEFFDHQV